MAETVRQIQIRGVAVDDYHKAKGTRKRRSPLAKHARQLGGDAPPGLPVTSAQNVQNARRMINAVGTTFQKGGASEQGAPQTSVAAKTDTQLITAPGTVPQNPNPVLPAVRASLEAGTAVLPVTPLPAPTPVAQTGGSKQVILGQKKSRKAKLLLTPPSGKRKAHAPVTKTRKIRVQLSGLKKRITKQKTITKDSREKPIAEVRKLLEEARLIKPLAEGKQGPPDSVLRDIYKDYLLLRNRAL
jgi:hypothetical protein